jgi:HemY protein
MKVALGLLAILFAGVIAAHFLFTDRGQVYVSFHGYALQTSVPVLLLMLIALYAAVRVIVRIVRVPRNVGRAAAALRARRAQDQLARGLLALDAGDWAMGERLLGRSAHDSDKPVLHYLGAARAAQQQGAQDRRDRWLELASEQHAGGDAAVLMTRAELLVAEGTYQPALALLRELAALGPEQPRALALQAQASAGLRDWSAVRELLPRLRKTRALAAIAIDGLELRAQVDALATAAASGQAEQVRAVWRGLGRDLTGKIELLRAYTKALADTGDPAGAEEVLRSVLKTQWDDELVERYGELETGEPQKQLKRAEEWLQAHPEDAVALLTAARLCMRNELWGKARSYLEASLALAPRADVYQLYGKLLEQLGERERAADAFRTGLALATGRGVPADVPAKVLALSAPKAI